MQNESRNSTVTAGSTVAPVKIDWKPHPSLAQNFTEGAIRTTAGAIAPIDTEMKPLPFTLN